MKYAQRRNKKSKIPRVIINKAHRIARAIIRDGSDVSNPYAVGMAVAKGTVKAGIKVARHTPIVSKSNGSKKLTEKRLRLLVGIAESSSIKLILL
jgi:hypothetical protein